MNNHDTHPDTATRQPATARAVELLSALAPKQGYNPTVLADVRILRADAPLPRMPVLHAPGMLLVCQGCKRDHIGEHAFEAGAGSYRLLTLPLPFISEIEASEEAPMLALHLRFDPRMLGELSHEVGAAPEPGEPARARLAGEMDEAMHTSLARLLDMLGDAQQARVLGKSMLRELSFRALTGTAGAMLHASLNARGRFGDVLRAVRLITARHMQPLTVERMAREAAMSVPSFHAHFRRITGCSPLQYLKTVRLHRARLLMARYQLTAMSACGQVGYESDSQFSREFKRLFGLPPAEEMARIRRGGVALPPEDEVFVPIV